MRIESGVPPLPNNDKPELEERDRAAGCVSEGALPDKNDDDGLQQDVDVIKKAPVIQILTVKLHDLLKILDLVSARNLPEPRYSGFA